MSGLLPLVIILGVGHQPLADTAFVGLLDPDQQLREHGIDARDDTLDLALTEAGLNVVRGEAVTLAAGVLADDAQQAFHRTEHRFRLIRIDAVEG